MNKDLGKYGNKFTSENASMYQKMGVEARNRKTAERKKMQETFNTLLKIAIKKGELVYTEDIQNMAEVENLNIDVQTAIAIAMVQRATMGDVQAAQFIRDTLGEKPTDKVQVDQSLTIEEWAKKHKVKL